MEEIKEKLSYREKANSTTRFSLPNTENYFNIHGIIIILYYYIIFIRELNGFLILSLLISTITPEVLTNGETGLSNLPRDLQSRQYVRWG